MRYLTVRELLLIHSLLIDESGGSHGVRDRNGIEAVIVLPQQSAFGKELYPTLFKKAAVYIRGIIQSHPFVDGNKRTGMAAANAFLELNGYEIVARRGEIYHFALRVAKEHLSLETIEQWIRYHSKDVMGSR